MNTKLLLNSEVHFCMHYLQLHLFPACGSHWGKWPLCVQRFPSHRRNHLERHHSPGAETSFLVTIVSESIASESSCLWSWCWLTCLTFLLWAARHVVTARRLNWCYMHHSLLDCGPTFWFAHAASYIKRLPIQVVVVLWCKSLNMLTKCLVYWRCYLFMDILAYSCT